MNRILIIFLFVSFFGRSQSVFNRVHINLAPSKNNLAILDSCELNNYFKDSVLFYKSMIALKQNKIGEAKLLSKELHKTFPDFYEVHYLDGLIYLSSKNYGKAINEFSLVLQKKPHHLKALYDRALAFGLAEDYDKAIEDLNLCISLKPMYSMAYYSRGYWNEFLGNYPAAIKDYENTINLDPKNYEAYFGLAYVYRKMKIIDKSCEVINNAIKAGSLIAEEMKGNFCK